ncbi:MAG: hypothetical protein JKY60_17500 [Kordiimonadaceae bacterium]|nr:hypothetical protein [Kordiimonadaceae bacterium]
MRMSAKQALKASANKICAESRRALSAQDRLVQKGPVGKHEIAPVMEARLVTAAWTLRRLPDRERGFLRMRGAVWPEMAREPGNYTSVDMSDFAARRSLRIAPAEIDAMQPTLDLLLLLPDLMDRQILFWTAWHQDGEVLTRIPWAKVRRSLGVTMSRWTLKRHYEAGLLWLAAIIAMQQ